MNNYNNMKLKRLIKGETHRWYSDIKEAKLLWCRFAGSTFWPAGYWIKHTDCKYLNIQLVEKGVLTLHIGNEKISVQEGSFLIIPPGSYILKADDPAGVHKKHMAISGNLCLQHLLSLGFDKPVILEDLHDPIFDMEFSDIFRMAEKHDPEYIFDYSAKCLKIMLLLADKIRSRDLPRTFVKAKSFIECNFANKIQLDDICRHAGCSKTTLQHQFRDIMSLSPMRYLTEVRMKYALELLEKEELSIKMISEMCGYDNPLYFSNVFKEIQGLYPREYRKMKIFS